MYIHIFIDYRYMYMYVYIYICLETPLAKETAGGQMLLKLRWGNIRRHLLPSKVAFS